MTASKKVTKATVEDGSDRLVKEELYQVLGEHAASIKMLGEKVKELIDKIEYLTPVERSLPRELTRGCAPSQIYETVLQAAIQATFAAPAAAAAACRQPESMKQYAKNIVMIVEEVLNHFNEVYEFPQTEDEA